MKRATWLWALLAGAVALGLPFGRAAAGPATGNPENTQAVFFPVVQQARLVCVADPTQECPVDLDLVSGDPQLLVSDRQILCTTETCGAGNECPGNQTCRPAFVDRQSEPGIVELHGLMKVRTVQSDAGSQRTLSITIETVFPADRNPLTEDKMLAAQTFTRTGFEPPDLAEFPEPVECAGDFSAPGVLIHPGGWFPAGSDECVFDLQCFDLAGSLGKAVDFNGMLIPIGGAAAELVAIAKAAFPAELAGFDPVPLVIDLRRANNGKNLGEITRTEPLCAHQVSETGTPGGTREGTYEVVVRFAEPKGLVARLCDANRDGGVDQDDIAVIMASQGDVAGTNDPRDADSNGRIDVVDARTCVVLCDVEGCARP
jgi:hypothetical protein